MSSTHAPSYSDLKVLIESKMAKILKITQENEKLKADLKKFASGEYENKALHMERETLKKENARLAKENEELTDHAMNSNITSCEHCGLTTTEDDLFLSLECGEFTCEECFHDGKSKNMKEQVARLEKENEELKDQNEHWRQHSGGCEVCAPH
jgi:FtsZ-binding cell division protein ZapB